MKKYNKIRSLTFLSPKQSVLKGQNKKGNKKTKQEKESSRKMDRYIMIND